VFSTIIIRTWVYGSAKNRTCINKKPRLNNNTIFSLSIHSGAILYRSIAELSTFVVKNSSILAFSAITKPFTSNRACGSVFPIPTHPSSPIYNAELKPTLKLLFLQKLSPQPPLRVRYSIMCNLFNGWSIPIPIFPFGAIVNPPPGTLIEKFACSCC